MNEAHRSQSISRATDAICLVVGWVVVVVGLLLALAGALTGVSPLISGAIDASAGLIARIIAASLGLGVALIGFYGVTLAGLSRAVRDQADVSLELRALLREWPAPATPELKGVSQPAHTQTPKDPLVIALGLRGRIGASKISPIRNAPPLGVRPHTGAPDRKHPIFTARPPQ